MQEQKNADLPSICTNLLSMKRIWQILLTFIVLVVLVFQGQTVQAQPTDSQQQLAEMSVAEKIGQLFLVPFVGASTEQSNAISTLIVDYHVGNVILLPENDNLINDTQIATLTNELQTLALQGGFSRLPQDALVEEGAVPPSPTPLPNHLPIPLLIAIDDTALTTNLSNFPSYMALGASWNPTAVNAVGSVVGQELEQLGINMLLGPTLDVLERPFSNSSADPNTTIIGGSPYWVGHLGSAYVDGLLTGSNGRLAIVPKHFPGIGDSDRALNEEIPTIRRSFEQLQASELVPFSMLIDSNQVQGLLTSHSRYQGLQGNVRQNTNPISLDPTALTSLMNQYPEWRNNGGLLVSDSLGVRAIQRFYDNTEANFPHRRIARDALLAGNDLLYLGEFALDEGNIEQQVSNTIDTIEWFQQLYEEDPTFQQRVDEAVLRILDLKQQLYPNGFTPEEVIVDPTQLTLMGDADMVALAQTAVTLLAPNNLEQLSPPALNQNLLIFTQIQTIQPCSTCATQPIMGETQLQDRILALYGPDAVGQIQPQQIASYTFNDLQTFMDAGTGPFFLPTPEPPISPTVQPTATVTVQPTLPPPVEYQLQEQIREANWLIFALIDGDTSTLSQLLAERPDLLQGKQVIVFSYTAPTYLDATEISKLTAYYGIYSHHPAFVDTSARTLFQEVSLVGAPPVSITGINYDIAHQTQPDPTQQLQLFTVADDGSAQAPPSEEPQTASIGDVLILRTGVIYDRNGNPVPDGTLVRFKQLDRTQSVESIIGQEPTKNGIAELDYVLDLSAAAGQLRISAETGEATNSEEVNINIEGDALIAIVSPTPVPTVTPTHTPTPMPTNTPTPIPLPSQTPLPQATPTLAPNSPPALQIELSALLMLVSFFVGLSVVSTTAVMLTRRQPTAPHLTVRGTLWSLIGALLLYNLFIFKLLPSPILDLNIWGGILLILLGGGLGFAIYQRWGKNL